MEENWNLDIDSYPKRLITCDGETLADKDLPPTKFIIKGLLPQGLALLSGSPKVGKSWLTLDLVVRIAKGEQVWNFPTDRGTTLYISLEDTESRLQERLLTITDEAPPDVHFATNCLTIGDGLEEQIRNFVTEHPHTVFVAIDIFQKVRSNNEVSYSVDYNEMEILKQLSQELKIAILLVHHVRKEKADDPFDMISGSNGLAGCADTEFVLLKSKRSSGDATLHCTGRDIEDREILLRFNKETCTWEYISDSVENPETLLPTELQKLIEMMKEKSFFSGSNADFVALFNTYSGTDIKANALKRKMSIRVSEDDLNIVHYKAEQAKLTLTEYVTKCALGRQIFVIDGLDEVIRQQKAIGKNLNRLTVLSNMGKISSVNLEQLTEEYAALNRTLTELLDRKRWSA